MLDHGTSEETIRRRAEMALAVDESLGRLMAALEKNNELDNTVIMFTSDNGFFFGEHIQGRSLAPLLQGNATDWRESVLIEFYTYENPRPWLMDMDYRAVRTERFKLIHWIQHPGEQELYDLQEDPYEMHNLIDDPKAQDLVDELQVELARLVVQAMGLSESR